MLRLGHPRRQRDEVHSEESSILATLTRGTPVFAERSDGDWSLVRTPEGEVGWVFAPLLEKG